MRDLETIELALTAPNRPPCFRHPSPARAPNTIDRTSMSFRPSNRTRSALRLPSRPQGVVAQNLSGASTSVGLAALEVLVVDPPIANPYSPKPRLTQIPGMMQVGKKREINPSTYAIMEHLSRARPHRARRSLLKSNDRKKFALPENPRHTIGRTDRIARAVRLLSFALLTRRLQPLLLFLTFPSATPASRHRASPPCSVPL